MQKIETIVSIPLYELGGFLTDDDYEKYSKQHGYVQIEMTHDYSRPDRESGLFSDDAIYKGFRPLGKYGKPILDAVSSFLCDESSQEYHRFALDKYREYLNNYLN